MKTRFVKMQGLGNDFVVIESLRQHFEPTAVRIQQLGSRQYGIGFDQLLLIQASKHPEADFCYRIFNRTGEEVEQCGNGARCIAKFIRDEELSAKNPVIVETKAGLIALQLMTDDRVKVQMSVPKLEHVKEQIINTVRGELAVSIVDMGNPHAVIRTDSIDQAPVVEMGAILASHDLFPMGVNVGFMQIINRNSIRLRVFERGVGETLACGSGACAAVVSGIINGLLDKTVSVSMPGGELTIEWQGASQPVNMTGPAFKVFEGII